MEWKAIGESLLHLAPTLASCIGGPVGVIAGGAISVLTKFLGLPDGATAEESAAALAKLSPEQYVALRKQDDEFKQSLLDAGVKLEEIAMQDRKSAREMQIATKSWTPEVLAIAISAGFFGMLALMWYKPPTPESKDLLNIMVTVLGSGWTLMLGFYYGSSAGSDKLKNILGAGK